jgi:hypothetical protein
MCKFAKASLQAVLSRQQGKTNIARRLLLSFRFHCATPCNFHRTLAKSLLCHRYHLRLCVECYSESDSSALCDHLLVIPSSMSRFWAGRDDQSASESESDSGSDSSAAAAKKGQKERRQWALDSDSESEDEVRVVKSAKDRCVMFMHLSVGACIRTPVASSADGLYIETEGSLMTVQSLLFYCGAIDHHHVVAQCMLRPVHCSSYNLYDVLS